MNHLDLNKKRVRKNVISKLNTLGYNISDDADIRKIRTIVREIQIKNGLIADGYIGDHTYRLLGYDMFEYNDMLRISNSTKLDNIINNICCIVFWLLFLAYIFICATYNSR